MTLSWENVIDEEDQEPGTSRWDHSPELKVDMLFEKYQAYIEDVLSRYPVKRSAILPLLNLAQREEGYVSETAMKEIAKILDLTPPQVYETVTFYTMLHLRPIGRFHIQVCKSLMCALIRSDELIQWLQIHLGISVGETTKDGLFTLSAVECLGSCGTGPMMQINDDYYERLTEEKVGRILEDLKTSGDSPMKSGPFMFPEPVR